MHNRKKLAQFNLRRQRAIECCIASATLLAIPVFPATANAQHPLKAAASHSSTDLGIVRALGLKQKNGYFPSVSLHITPESLPTVSPPNHGFASEAAWDGKIVPVAYTETKLGLAPPSDRVVMRIAPPAPVGIQLNASDSQPQTLPSSRGIAVHLSDSKSLAAVVYEPVISMTVTPEPVSATSTNDLGGVYPANPNFPADALVESADLAVTSPTNDQVFSSEIGLQGNTPDVAMLNNSIVRAPSIVRVKPTIISFSPDNSATQNLPSADGQENPSPVHQGPSFKITLLKVNPDLVGLDAEPASLPRSLSAFVKMAEPTVSLDTEPIPTETNRALTERIESAGVPIQTAEASAPLENLTASPIEQKTPFPTSVNLTSTVQISHLSGQVVRLSAPFSQVMVEDEKICKIIPMSDREFSIVGSQVGSTRVAIWLLNATEPVPSAIQVDVQKPWQTPMMDASDDARKLSEAIAQMHPNCKVELSTAKDGSLVVRGLTDSEASAKQILALIRKLCLIPVRDQLQVRPR